MTPDVRALMRVCVLMVLLVALGALNFILVKIAYTSYGDQFSFFVNQGINFLYVVYGGIILYPLMLFTTTVTPEMRKFPQRRFFFLGCLDAFGTFFTAMGAVYTPGTYQTLLNQTLIPFTMLASWRILGTTYQPGSLLGALLILVGAVVAVAPTLLDADSSSTRWYSCGIYMMSNLPMALSAVYKETAFKDETVNVWYLNQWVSVYQFLISFVFVPLLAVPFIGGSDTGTPLNQVASDFAGGWFCFLETQPECVGKGTMWVLPTYCFVNFLYNYIGCLMMLEGSAVLRGFSYAMLLPVITVAYSFPFMGPYREFTTVYTWVGLVVVVLGFGLYQRYMDSDTVTGHNETTPLLVNVADLDDAPAAGEGGGGRGGGGVEQTASVAIEQEATRVFQASFQERVIGMGKAHRKSSFSRADGKSINSYSESDLS